jgi:anaerobic selenocysteine-containing dehydrogenase
MCGLPSGQVEAAARMLWQARPGADQAWNGVEMPANSPQNARMIAQLAAPAGSRDAPGGPARCARNAAIAPVSGLARRSKG